MTPIADADPLRHDHVFLDRDHERNARRTRIVVVLTAAMMLAEIAAGAVFQSMALLADGVHMATHAGALGIAAFAYGFARRHARDPRYCFGTGKVGDLAGFASALILGVVALGIAVESIGRVLDPRPVAFTEATIVAVVGLVVNLVSAALLGGGAGQGAHGHAHDHVGHNHAVRDHAVGDNNIRAAFLHVVADALTSVLAIVALLAGAWFGMAWLDPAVGILGAVVIASWAVSLLRDTARILLDTTDPRLNAEVRARVESAGGARITDLHVWRVGPGAHAAIVSVTGTTDAEAVRSRLAPLRALAHVTVETRE